MKTPWQAALAAGLLLLGGTRAAWAQIDYRNLDDDRPVRVEDAYPVERHAFEFLLPWRYARETGSNLNALIPEVEYGLLRNAQLGLKVPVAVEDGGAGTVSGVSGLWAFALYNFNTESRRLPALSLRVDGTFPVGALAGSETHVSAKALATRSFGRNRLHLNGAWRFGPDGTLAAVEAAPRWWYGAAVDRTLFRSSMLIVAEVTAVRESDAAAVAVNAAVGLRRQVTPTLVFDAGVARRLRSGSGPALELTLGFSHAFAIAALMPRRPVPMTPAPEGGAREQRP